jgi:hypothetical protein
VGASLSLFLSFSLFLFSLPLFFSALETCAQSERVSLARSLLRGAPRVSARRRGQVLSSAVRATASGLLSFVLRAGDLAGPVERGVGDGEHASHLFLSQSLSHSPFLLFACVHEYERDVSVKYLRRVCRPACETCRPRRRCVKLRRRFVNRPRPSTPHRVLGHSSPPREKYTRVRGPDVTLESWIVSRLSLDRVSVVSERSREKESGHDYARSLRTRTIEHRDRPERTNEWPAPSPSPILCHSSFKVLKSHYFHYCDFPCLSAILYLYNIMRGPGLINE